MDIKDNDASAVQSSQFGLSWIAGFVGQRSSGKMAIKLFGKSRWFVSLLDVNPPPQVTTCSVSFHVVFHTTDIVV
jgi:hypothetical protein